MTDAGPVARVATLDDIDELVRMRALMFGAMGIELADQSWRLDAGEHYERMLSNGRIVGAVVDRVGSPGLLSSGVVSFLDQIPSPTRPFSTIAHISSMCTEPDHQRMGLGAMVLDLLVDQVRQRGVSVVELHATTEGESLYRSRGFGERVGGLEMRAVLH